VALHFHPEQNPNHGICALCRHTGDLCDSHLIPKALYRLLLAKDRASNPNPVFVAPGVRLQTSFQATRHLLCHHCEQRLHRGGEDWVLRHCYRGCGRFRLRELLRASKPLHAENNFTIYRGSTIPGLSIGALTFFCVSVFWRASVCDWKSSGRKYQSISLGRTYQEEIRRYLLGTGDLPTCSSILVIASALSTPPLVFSFPQTMRVNSRYCHTLHIPGLMFQLSLGRQSEPGETESCIVRSPFHPIFECIHGDARLQRGIFKSMGKIAPLGTEYPVVDGVI
jgi:hypothetical protein